MLNPQNPHGGRRESTSTSCSLTSTFMLWHRHAPHTLNTRKIHGSLKRNKIIVLGEIEIGIFIPYLSFLASNNITMSLSNVCLFVCLFILIEIGPVCAALDGLEPTTWRRLALNLRSAPSAPQYWDYSMCPHTRPSAIFFFWIEINIVADLGNTILPYRGLKCLLLFHALSVTVKIPERFCLCLFLMS